MAEFVVVYTGGGMAPSEEEQKQIMAAWSKWFESLGDSVVNMGNPFGASKSIAGNGDVSDGGKSQLTGYSVLKANSLDAAVELAKDCPVLGSEAGLEIYEAQQM